jgi:hypothetical protein
VTDPLIYSKMKDFCIATIQEVIANNPTVFTDAVTVYRQMQKDETNIAYPCITVVEVRMNPETTGYMAGDTENYYWMLPFNILIQDREAGSLHVDEPKYMGWHQCLMDNFRQALLTDNFGKPFVQAEVFPKPVLEPNDGRYQDVAGGMFLKFWAIESRS